MDGEEASPSEAIELTSEDKLGKYEIRRLLGKGAMGAVYLAFDPMIEREVAIKVLPTQIAAHPLSLSRFLTEARSTGKLNHPNVVSLFDIAEQDGLYYIVMEVLNGGSLGDLTDNGKALPWKQACEMVAQAADGLSAAHAQGLVHRDIKPDNLMSTQDGIVKVVDFGLSKLVDVANDSREAVTKTGAILGTPQYMSPEQCEAEAVDARADVYSLGATLHRLLTGFLPYERYASIMQVMMAHVNKPIPNPLEHNADLPPACKDIVAKAMAKKPEDRYQDAADMATDLRSLIASDSFSGSAAENPQQYKPLESVVVVEPSKMQGLMQRDAFNKAGVKSIYVCTNATGARTAIDGSNPHVVISAMQLDDGRGLDLFLELRKQERGRDVMHVLNSSDFTLSDMVDLGLTSPFALVSKKTRPDEILRAIHACTWSDFADGPLTESIDPTASRFLIICDSERIPEPIAELARRLNLLDLQVTTFDALSAGKIPSGTIDLAFAVRTAGNAENDTAVYSGMLNRVQIEAHAVAAIQVDGRQTTLRAIRRGGFAAVTMCPLDDARLTRLVRIIQK